MSYKIRKLRKKPIEIEGIQFFDDSETINAIGEFTGQQIRVDYGDPEKPRLRVDTIDNFGWVYEGDWVLKGVKGEFYPCDGAVAAESYELL